MAAPGGKGGAGAGAGKGGGAAEEKKDAEKPAALDSSDIQLLKAYGAGPYAATIKRLEADIVDEMKAVNELIGECCCCGGGEAARPHRQSRCPQASRRARRDWRHRASGIWWAMRR